MSADEFARHLAREDAASALPDAQPRRCPICGDPSDYHCGDLGCTGSWTVPGCACTLTAAQVEMVSADV